MWMPLRIIGFISISIFHYLFIKAVAQGIKFNKDSPIKGWRGSVLKYSYKFSGTLLHLNCGMSVQSEHVDVDYSEYLGPDYKTTNVLPLKISTVVSNHVSHLDFAIVGACEF